MKVKRFFITILVILIGFFGTKFILDRLNFSRNYNINGSDVTFDDDAINKEKGQYLILLVGVDKNGDDESNKDFTRTDTIMLISADTKTGNMELLSIPRDSRIKIRDKFDKVNHAHAFGGIELTMQTLRQFLGLDIDYYVQIDYQALMNIVDALGGVDYNVPEGIVIDKGSVQIKPGPNHLNGNEVLWYLRTRSIYNSGDIGRVNTQQAFVKAMVDEIVNKSKNINLMTFITNYIKYVKTNLPMNAMFDLAGHINKFSSDKMTTHTVPGMATMIDGVSYWIPDYQKTWDIVDQYYSNFKLEKWTKEDSGYEEYEDYGQIEDESQYSGVRTNEDSGNEEYYEDPAQYNDNSYTEDSNETYNENWEQPEEDEYYYYYETIEVPVNTEQNSETTTDDTQTNTIENNESKDTEVKPQPQAQPQPAGDGN